MHLKKISCTEVISKQKKYIERFFIVWVIPYYETPSAHLHPVLIVQLIYLHQQPVHHLPERW